MLGSCLGLVADDLRLINALGSHLKKSFGPLGFTCGYDQARAHLGHDVEGAILLTATSPMEIQRAHKLAQEVCLLKHPNTLFLLASNDVAQASEVSSLSGYLAAPILQWPNDPQQLETVLRERINRGRGFRCRDGESMEETIGRRLLAWTPSLLPMVDRIALAASHDVTVLLTGETGTGKTHLARLVHDCSPRASDKFLCVPCGALSANLVESEFFGHVKGAFTGADRPKVGKFAAAGNGSILLDEIDALPLEQQANLLRVIETGEYEPVGGNETQICTARIIVASNWNLDEAVERGKFRQDLYYRLNVMSFHLPPLRERIVDIAPLVRGMALRYAEKFRKPLFDIHPDAMGALEAYNWPGNIRQLENAIQQSVLVSSGSELLLKHLPVSIQEFNANNEHADQAPADSLTHNREVTERSVIQRALASNGYSRARAAQSLGVSRVTLYKKMKKYGLMEVPMHPAQAL